MRKHFLFLFSLLLLNLFHCTRILAQSPAPSPAPPGPTNVTAVLEKAGRFTTLIRLLQNTQVADRINTQLNNSNEGVTMLAPTDSAFSSLQSGTLNSLTDEQKVELLQFHLIPSFLSIPQFQTVSNPLRTQAGDTSQGQFPLNVTTIGNQVNISTGIDNSTIANTVYTDGQLAVYEVDQVLLPLNIFGPHAPAPAPSKSKKKPSSSDDPSASSGDSGVDSSGAVGLFQNIILALGFATIAAFLFDKW